MSQAEPGKATFMWSTMLPGRSSAMMLIGPWEPESRIPCQSLEAKSAARDWVKVLGLTRIPSWQATARTAQMPGKPGDTMLNSRL